MRNAGFEFSRDYPHRCVRGKSLRHLGCVGGFMIQLSRLDPTFPEKRVIQVYSNDSAELRVDPTSPRMNAKAKASAYGVADCSYPGLPLSVHINNMRYFLCIF